MSHPVDVWGPCPPSAAPPGGGNTQGLSPSGGSVPMYWTQIEAPLAPLPHKTSQMFSYPLPPFPKYFPAVPIFPAPSWGSVPPLSSICWRTKTSTLGKWMKEPPSAVTHTPRRPPYPFLCFLNNQPPMLPLRPTPAHIWSRLRPIECLLWLKHVTLGSPGLGLIPLLQDYYAVPRVSVRKVHPVIFMWGR